MKSVVLWTLLSAAPLAAWAGVKYDDAFFKEHYSHIVKLRPAFPDGTPILPGVTSKSPDDFATAVLTQTDPTKVSYDEETAYIEIKGEDIQPLYIEVKNFRAVWLSWATGRILVIGRDIGHTAAMEEVLDVVGRRWLSQTAVLYGSE
jgi:hypothetical protein